MIQKTAAAIAGLALFANAFGAEPPAGPRLDWSLDAGVARTDNANLSHSDRVYDTVMGVGGGLVVGRRGTRFETTLEAGGSFLHYADDTFDDDFLGRATGNLRVFVLPERVSWTFDDNYGQVANNPFAPSTPENRQDVNVFSTGPDVSIGLAPGLRLQLSARYGDTWYEDTSELNNRNWGGIVGLTRELSPANSLALFVGQMRYDYDRAGIPMYDQQAAWIAWRSQRARDELSIEAGVNRVDLARYHSMSDPMVRIGWERRLRPNLTMNVLVGHEYQNADQQFVGGTTTNTGITALPALVRRGDLSFTYEMRRTNVTVGGGLRDLDYDPGTEFNEDGWSLHADLGRRFTQRLQGFLVARVDRRKFDVGPVRTLKEKTASAGLDWRAGRSTFVTLAYTRTESDGNAIENQYSGNLYSARISWRSDGTIGPRTLDY